MIKVTPYSIAYFESEKRRPKWEVLIRMAKALDTTEYYLITGRAKPRAPRKMPIDKTYFLVRSLIVDKDDLDKLEFRMEKFLAARLRFD